MIGTGLLLAAIVGSRTMGERLAGGNVAIALLANSIATGAVLAAAAATVLIGWLIPGKPDKSWSDERRPDG